MNQGESAPIVLVHGAWHGGWCWRKLVPLLRAAGHELFAPTLTGLGERAHLLNPQVGLDTHIDDIAALLEYEDLHNVILVGHSYGGMVITGVAERAASRLAGLVYLDAFVPQDGQSLLDTLPDGGATVRAQAAAVGESWKVPVPVGTFGVTDESDIQWLTARLTPQPLKSFTEPVRLTTQAARTLPRTYILCRQDQTTIFDIHAEQAKQVGWNVHELRTGHDAMISVPQELVELLI
ncbi:MAG: alpha/beta fold hydrolase [Caldilineaceae bacterium]